METKTAAMKTKVYESCTMDYTTRIEHAQRSDGQWFKRIQGRDPRFGYKWGRWIPTTFGPRDGVRARESSIRLPKAVRE